MLVLHAVAHIAVKENGMGKQISLKEYAKRNRRAFRSIQYKAQCGGFLTAQKTGRDWFIDENEPFADMRTRTRQ